MGDYPDYLGLQSWLADWGVNPPAEGRYIWVRNARIDDRVALWERHPRHPFPGGEVLIAGPTPEPVQVWTTELVQQKLRAGELIRVASGEEAERRESFIWVKAANQDDRVGLWDRDSRHPGGEIFIVGNRTGNAPVQVYPTDKVLDALERGVLIRVPSVAEEEAVGDWELAGCLVCGHALLYHSYPERRWCMQCPENVRRDCIAMRGSPQPADAVDQRISLRWSDEGRPEPPRKPAAPWAKRKSRRIR